MHLPSVFLALILVTKQFSCQTYASYNNFSDELHSYLRDVQLGDNDTSLALNFENANDKQFPFYLHASENYKFNMEKFTEDFVQIKFINLVNSTEHVNGTICLKKVQNTDALKNESDELAHYELVMNSTKHLSDLCWNLTIEKDLYWYGAPAILQQHWPIDPKLVIPEQPYITSSYYKNSTGSLVEYLWFSSFGYLVFVERDVPLFIKLENSILCLSAKNNHFPYLSSTKKSQQIDRVSFKAHIIISKSVKQAYLYYLNNFVKRPERTPNPAIYSTNIWSTRLKFKMNMNQQNLIDYARDISSSGLNKYGSIFEIDDRWDNHYGDWQFDKSKFADAKKMIDDIKKLGNFRISVWLTPFFHAEVVDNQLDTEERTYMVKESNSYQNMRLKWWNGENATYLDSTNPRARRWFNKRVRKMLTEYNIDTIKVDAGEIDWVKTPFKLFLQEVDSSPNKYSEYLSLMIRDFENSSFVKLRTGFNSQTHGNLIQILDKDSNWSYNNGLKTLIPSCLTYSIMGYPFILSNIIGGSSYDQKPDRGLYIRWLAVNSLLPVMQYSIAPFDFDEEVVKVALKFQELHNQFTSTFAKLAEEAKKTGFAIIRPMWWIAPEDKNTWTIDDQYLIGNDILVAPILKQASVKRSIYIPSGKWVDELRNFTLSGPTMLENYEIKLHEIAYFTRSVE